MKFFNDLNDETKYLFTLKFSWLVFFILTNIYCITMLTTIHMVKSFLAIVLFINTILLLFVFIDICIIFRNNAVIFPEIITRLIIFCVPNVYYIALIAKLYNFAVYEFVLMFTYTLLSIVFIIPVVINYLQTLRGEFAETISIMENRGIKFELYNEI